MQQFSVAPRDIRARLDLPNSRKLLDMARVIGARLAGTGDDFKSFMDYFFAVKYAEHVLSDGQVDTPKRFYYESMERRRDFNDTG